MKNTVKNEYTTPVIEVYKATREDVISTSGFDGPDDLFGNKTKNAEAEVYNF